MRSPSFTLVAVISATVVIHRDQSRKDKLFGRILHIRRTVWNYAPAVAKCVSLNLQAPGKGNKFSVFFFFFSDEQTETQRGKTSFQRHMAHKERCHNSAQVSDSYSNALSMTRAASYVEINKPE